jgi:hypothetical protein
MSKRQRLALTLILVSCVLGVGFAAKTKADFDKNADFSSYKTYAWGQNQLPTRQSAGMVITYAIDAQLQSTGLRQVQVEDADLIVRYAATSDRGMNFGVEDPTYAVVGGAPLHGSTVWTSGFNVPTGGRYVRQGSLIIDIFDRQQRKLIWSATASAKIHDKTEKAIQQINKIVTEMFSRYPGRSLPT